MWWFFEINFLFPSFQGYLYLKANLQYGFFWKSGIRLTPAICHHPDRGSAVALKRRETRNIGFFHHLILHCSFLKSEFSFFLLLCLHSDELDRLSDRRVRWWSGIYYNSQPKDYSDVGIVINWTINQRNYIRDRKEKSQNCQDTVTQNIYQTNKICKIVNGLFGSYSWMFITYFYKLVAYRVPTTLRNIWIY
jgi:hypothetical protein